jgi:hypothetical protein
MFSDEGGVGTTSSSVRRGRFRRAGFDRAAVRAVRPRPEGRERRAGDFLRLAGRRVGRFLAAAFLVCLRRPRADLRLGRRVDFLAFARFAMRFRSFQILDSFAISVVLSIAYRNLTAVIPGDRDAARLHKWGTSGQAVQEPRSPGHVLERPAADRIERPEEDV